VVNAVLCSNNGDVLRAAALAGRGIALLPTFLAGPDIASGRLSRVLEGYVSRELGIYALYASKRFLAAKTRAFIDFLVDRFGEEPEWDRYGEAANPPREADAPLSQNMPSRLPSRQT
jgi:DNA-binding transcriptional LysR family regulator